MKTAKEPSYRLTFDDAVKVWQRYWSGETQMRIAASYDCNIGRVNEVIKGYRHPGSELVAKATRH